MDREDVVTSGVYIILWLWGNDVRGEKIIRGKERGGKLNKNGEKP